MSIELLHHKINTPAQTFPDCSALLLPAPLCRIPAQAYFHFQKQIGQAASADLLPQKIQTPLPASRSQIACFRVDIICLRIRHIGFKRLRRVDEFDVAPRRCNILIRLHIARELQTVRMRSKCDHPVSGSCDTSCQISVFPFSSIRACSCARWLTRPLFRR